MAEKKKVFVIIPPSTGHINPMCGIVSELSKDANVNVIFYSDAEYKETVEKAGAQFRLFAKPTFTTNMPHQPLTEKPMSVTVILGKMITFTHDLLPQLIRDAERDKPDLILYDNLFSPAKCLIKVLQRKHAKGTLGFSMPKTVMLYPNFVFNKKLMNETIKSMSFGISDAFKMIFIFFRQIWLSILFGLSSYNPLELLGKPDSNTNIVGVTEEIQPYREEFNDKYTFIGPCITEQARSHEIIDDAELKKLLSEFDSKPVDSKLIYMSLGTVFNANIFLFERAIEALHTYDSKQPQRRLKSSQFKVIMSVGEKGLKQLEDKIKSGQLKLPKNTLLRVKVPQLEVLKRADLYITHCGMNSINETIKYAVPIVALPLAADQPMVSRRCCDELSLGVRLFPLTVKPNEISDAIDEVLSDEKYRKNVEKLSKLSSKYNGPISGAKIILDCLNQKNADAKKSE